MSSIKTYTHEELKKFKEFGVEGSVCICGRGSRIGNSMQIECYNCGKILPEYARRFMKQQIRRI